MLKKSYPLTTDKGTKCTIEVRVDSNGYDRLEAMAEGTDFLIAYWEIEECETAEEVSIALAQFIKSLKYEY